jgi:hypothetical protein
VFSSKNRGLTWLALVLSVLAASAFSGTESARADASGVPTVAATTPGDGAVGISPYANATVTFDEDMNPTSFAGAVTLTRDDGLAVGVGLSYDAGSRTLKVIPAATLDLSHTYTIRLSSAVTALDGTPVAAPFSFSFTVQPNGVYWRTNSGGGDYVASDGTFFAADSGYYGGWVHTTQDAISGTADPALYQSDRLGWLVYSIPVPNGTYDVVLRFVETQYRCRYQRIFNVDVLQTATSPDLPYLDIFAAAGGADRALVETIPNVSVTRHLLALRAAAIRGVSEIAAIEVIPRNPAP